MKKKKRPCSICRKLTKIKGDDAASLQGAEMIFCKSCQRDHKNKLKRMEQKKRDYKKEKKQNKKQGMVNNHAKQLGRETL